MNNKAIIQAMKQRVYGSESGFAKTGLSQINVGQC